jgi:hypothetical protein
MRNGTWAVRCTVLGALMMSSTAGLAQESAKEQSALATALKAKHVALASGLEAAAGKGKPISAKYEVEDGKLQLSVYTEKAGQFSEVIVDHHSGKVTTSEKISSGDDLKDAQAQSAAMAKASTSLTAALRKAMASNKGYSAVSATAALKNGKPIAEITLHKGSEFKTVTEPLS